MKFTTAMTHLSSLKISLRQVLAFLGILFFSWQAAQAQQAMVLTKRKSGRVQKIMFVGDRITFREKSSAELETGHITGLEETGFRINGRFIPYDSLALVSETKRGLKLGIGLASVAAGAVVLFAGFQGFWVYPLGATLIGTGLVQAVIYGTRLLLHNRYDVTRKWKVQTRIFIDE